MPDRIRSAGSGRKNLLLILLILLTVAAVAAAAILYFQDAAGGKTLEAREAPAAGFDTAALVGSLDGAPAGDISPAGEFHYQINSQVTVRKGMANFRIENPIENRYLMKVTVSLSDGAVIYTTDFIRPYHYIEEDKLDAALKKGTYTARAKIEAFDRDTQEAAMSAEEEISITVES